MDDEKYYVTVSFDSITKEDAKEILEEIVRLRGTIKGMSVSYGEAIE